MMQHHCARWGTEAPISVAVLTNETKSETMHRLAALGCNESQLRLEILALNAESILDYPVNALRNLALSNVETTHVMYVDIDFWESTRLRNILHTKPVVEALANDTKLAIVVPAFQLTRQCTEYRDCQEENVPLMPGTKEDLIELILDRQASPFDPTNRGGHGSTLYSVWANQESGQLEGIPCIRSNRYEPYLAFRYCRDMPPFQKAFSGYGKNKMTVSGIRNSL